MGSNQKFGETSLVDAFRLLWLIVSKWLRNPCAFRLIDPLDAWLRECEKKYGDVFHVRLFKLDWLFVNNPKLAKRIIEPEPESSGFTAGKIRKTAMLSLAPQALTVLNDQTWRNLRAYNENVLAPDRIPVGDARFLQAVEAAFQSPVSGFRDIKQGMGKVMLEVLFGQRNADPKLPILIDELMDQIENPIRRRLQKRSLDKKRAELFDYLRAYWRMSPPADSSLLSLGRRNIAADCESIYLDQIPHWMFTFVRSGSEWITRSLAMILSSPQVYERCLAEAKKAWAESGVDASQDLPFIQACMVETARLYPPVVWTFHQCPDGAQHAGRTIAPGTEIFQVFTLWERRREGEAFHPETHLNEPERITTPDPLFLGGARRCPGRSLITRLGAYVIARQLATHRLSAQHVLNLDHLPFAIKDERLHFKAV